MCAKILDLDVRSWALLHNYATATSRAVRLCINDSDSRRISSSNTLCSMLQALLFNTSALAWIGG